MYKITITELFDEETNPNFEGQDIYSQVVQELDVAGLICEVLNKSEYGESENDCDEFGHEHGCPLSPATQLEQIKDLRNLDFPEKPLTPDDFGGEDYPDFPFGTIVKGFSN